MRRIGSLLVSYLDIWFLPAALTTAWFYYPYCEHGPTLCIWRLLFHVHCPGCGLTRGICFLVHGKWNDAMRFNPLSALAVALMTVNFAKESGEIIRSRLLGAPGSRPSFGR
jgi:hypothetical protein